MKQKRPTCPISFETGQNINETLSDCITPTKGKNSENDDGEIHEQDSSNDKQSKNSEDSNSEDEEDDEAEQEIAFHLSGGMKQRVAIARTILKNPRILILDEATSCLENSKEARVQRLLLELLHLTTIITVAHRLANIMQYDRW